MSELPIPKNPDDWYHADDPLPDDPETLLRQITRAARARQQAALHHDKTCTCSGCRVRRNTATRAWARRHAA